MIKAILFDCWGTLVEAGVHSPIKQVKEILGISIPFSEYVLRMERAMMTRSFPTLRDAFLAVCTEFRIEPSEEKLEALIGMWNKSWMLAQPYPEVAEVLPELKKSYRLILVSNTDAFSVEQVLAKFDLRPHFELVYLSYEQGLLKTDQHLLGKILDDLQLMVDECVLVGDSLQSDIAAARRVGMKAILIDRRSTRDFTPKIKNLRELAPLARTISG